MEIELTNIQKQVDAQIESRLKRICFSEWLAANTKRGKLKRKPVPVTYSKEVRDLLQLRQDLYNGVDPEAISATINTGEIQDKFIKSKNDK